MLEQQGPARLNSPQQSQCRSWFTQRNQTAAMSSSRVMKCTADTSTSCMMKIGTILTHFFKGAMEASSFRGERREGCWPSPSETLALCWQGRWRLLTLELFASRERLNGTQKSRRNKSSLSVGKEEVKQTWGLFKCWRGVYTFIYSHIYIFRALKFWTEFRVRFCRWGRGESEGRTSGYPTFGKPIWFLPAPLFNSGPHWWSYPGNFSEWEIRSVAWERVHGLKCVCLTPKAWDLRALIYIYIYVCVIIFTLIFPHGVNMNVSSHS